MSQPTVAAETKAAPTTLGVATFTSTHGHINNGIILERGEKDPTMIKVLWDDFPELERLILERKSTLNAADERSVRMNVSWVDTERKHTNGASLSVAPLNGQKFYNRQLQAAIKGGTVEALAETVIDMRLNR